MAEHTQVPADPQHGDIEVVKCGCWTCCEERGERPWWMVVCATCGNKRCPHATDHQLNCTGSNGSGQAGSAYEHGSGAASVRRGALPPEPEKTS